MKKLKLSILLLIVPVLFILLISCDKVKHPDQRPPQIYHCIDTLHQVIKTNTLTSNSRKVLLEDYTGHTCPNCPRAAEAADALIAAHPNNLIVIANHVSKTFAAPNPDPDGLTYREDFRNDASTAWDSGPGGMGMSSAGLPQGTVNRTGIPNFPQAYTNWSNLVNSALSKPQVAKLDITTYYDTINRYLSTAIKTTFKTALPNDVNLIIVLTQDNIVADQKDKNPPTGSTVDPDDPSIRTDYKFDNIVIDAINGTWGQKVNSAPIAAKDTATIFNSCYLLKKCFASTVLYTVPLKEACVNDNYVNLVAFIYDVATYEVLQVEKLKIK